MDANALEDIAARLFQAFVAHDLDAVESMVATDVVVAQNGTEMGWAEARSMIEGLRGLLGDHHYTQVRRFAGDHAVVEEHHVVATLADGRGVDLPACVVIRVDDAGLIERMDEYVDTAPLAAS